LVALHGADGSGDGSLGELDNLFETGIPDLIRSDAWPTDRPFVVLFPQHEMPASAERYASCDGVPLFASCLMRLQHEAGHPADESLCMTPTEVHDFLSYAIATYDVDPQRVYLTGLSCGAFAAYEYAATYGAEQIAAMVPIAGEARPAWEAAGCTLGEVAIWAFHGDGDDVVDVQGTIEPMSDLMQCPGLKEPGVELTVYPGADHGSWMRTYDLSAGHDIYAWFLGIERADAQGDSG
jgi:predicted peptidase